ncbi:MAG: hypothetical protein LAP61_05640 [Acidobacteriia bacterium]|nr:hypothetical protein [Terriglobia bacterium]
MNIGELFVSLGFDVDEQKLKDFDEGVRSLEKHMLSLTAVATGSVIGLDVFLTRVADRATAMKQFGDQTGYSTQALQEWALVINRTNPLINVEQAQEKYKAFTEYIKNINWGAGGGNILSQLGVDYIPGADPAQYLEKLSQRLPDFIARYGRARAGMLLDQIGLGAGAIDALLTTAQQRKNMTAGLVIDDRELSHLDQVNRKLAELTQRWEKFEADLMDRWADPLIEGMDKIERGMEKWLPKINDVAQAIGGWKLIGETVLGFYAGRWLIGMLMAIGQVTLAAESLTAALVPALGVAAGTLGVGAGVGYLGANYLDKKTGWAQKFADWAYPVRDYHAGQRGNSTNSLTQHIHSTADPGAVGREAARMWDEWFQKQLNNTDAGINLGVPY